MPGNDFPDYLDNIDKIAAASPEQVRSEFGHLEGSYRFRVKDQRQAENNPSKFVTLRLDSENGVLSGDLFHDEAGRQWMLSWRSDALYSLSGPGPGERSFVAVCATFFPRAEKPHPFAKLVLSARLDPQGGLITTPDLRLAVIDGKDKLYDLAIDTKHPVDKAPSLRRIRLYVFVEPTLEADPYKEVIDRVIGHKGPDGELASTMKRERLLGEVIRRSVGGSGGAERRETDDPIEQITAMLNDLPNQDAQDNNSFMMILSAAMDEGDSDDIPLGRTIGIDALPSRFGSRRAAVVFPGEIRESFKRQRGQYPVSDEDQTEFAYRLNFTILHELGHLLNLPHCWQRDGFADVRLTAEPAEPTWMQYGSLFPLGSANEFALEQIETEADRRDKRDRLAGANFMPAIPPGKMGALREARFTRQEQQHLFHAPHDQISAGGRTFIDAERQVLSMQNPLESEPTLALTIDGARGEGAAKALTLQSYVNLRGAARFQPPTGKVRFRQRDENGDGKIAMGLPFRFSSGALFWLFREELETMWTNAQPRLELVYEPKLTLLAPDMLHPRRNLGGDVEEDAKGKFVDFIAPLPLLLPNFLFRRFKPTAHFTTQVVYISPGGKIYFSNQIRINFERNDEAHPFGRATSAIERLLSDEALPALGETALYFPRHPLDGLEGVAKMKRDLFSDDVRNAIEDRRESGWLGWLERLVIFVETRRFVEDHRVGLQPEPSGSWSWVQVGSEMEKILMRQVEESKSAQEAYQRFRSTM